MQGPAAWIRRREVPSCVRRWPTLIAAGWWGVRRASEPLAAILHYPRAEAWLGWVLVPAPGEWQAVLPGVLADVARCGGRILINPEADWLRATDDDARELVAALRAGGAREVWLCGYGRPVRGIPWAAWCEVCDGVIAQTYDREGLADGSVWTERTYIQESIDAWRAIGARVVLMSLGTWRSDQRRTKNASELSADLAARPPALTIAWVPQWTASVCRSLAAWTRGGAAGGAAAVALLGLLGGVAMLAARST